MKIIVTGSFGVAPHTNVRTGGFNANNNQAPSGYDGAITSNRGLALLHRIAGLG